MKSEAKHSVKLKTQGKFKNKKNLCKVISKTNYEPFLIKSFRNIIRNWDRVWQNLVLFQKQSSRGSIKNSIKNVFLITSQENTCVGVSFLIKLQAKYLKLY